MKKQKENKFILKIMVWSMVLFFIVLITSLFYSVLTAPIIAPIKEPYYSSSDSFCQYYNMTYKVYNVENTCIDLNNDTLIIKKITFVNGRYYFVGDKNV
jgi:hypothetical protein